MKDIFIDNNIAKNFANPLDSEYKKLVQWLITTNTGDKSTSAVLVICNQLIMEYGRTSSGAKSATNIWALVDLLTREGRINHIKNPDIKMFIRKYFTNRIHKCLKCGREDRNYIPVVLLSFRKYALVADDNLRDDLNNFPRFSACVEKRPEHLPYDS